MPKTAADVQRYTLRRRDLIEKNWTCDIQECIPRHVRPQESGNKGSKVKIGVNAPEASWSQWSYKFLVELESLSAMTIDKLVFAQELMTLEVEQRQQDLTSQQREIAEILIGDLSRINQDLKERATKGGESDDVDAEDDSDEDGEDESDADNIEEVHSVEQKETKFRSEPMDVEMVTDGFPQTEVSIMEAPTRKSKSSLKTKGQIASLRADAMRLKQEAARRLAEAYELEAKLLKAEAKDIE